MTGASLTARESEILRTLEAIYPKRDKFTLIGGYAVDAYSALPRYSVDCDIVISKAGFVDFATVFKDQGYEDHGILYRNELEGLEARKFIKAVGEDNVSVDLLIDGVRCRQTEAVWKEQEIRESSRELRVVGVTRSVLSRVASKELLIAMKLHSGRDPDLRDVVMLADSADWGLVSTMANRGLEKSVVSQLRKAAEEMSKSDFAEQMKASFGSKMGEQRRISTAISEVNRLLRDIEQAPHQE